MSPRLCLFDARADHLCFEALNVVLRSFNGVNVDEESGVVVARLGVTLGAIVTLGRVEERRVDAWDWALALSGIFLVVRRCAVLGVQRVFEPGGCVTPSCVQRKRHWAAGRSEATPALQIEACTALTPAAARTFAWFASALQAASTLCFWQLFWLVQPCELL